MGVKPVPAAGEPPHAADEPSAARPMPHNAPSPRRRDRVECAQIVDKDPFVETGHIHTGALRPVSSGVLPDRRRCASASWRQRRWSSPAPRQLARAHVVQMHRTPRVRPSAAPLGRPSRSSDVRPGRCSQPHESSWVRQNGRAHGGVPMPEQVRGPGSPRPRLPNGGPVSARGAGTGRRRGRRSCGRV